MTELVRLYLREHDSIPPPVEVIKMLYRSPAYPKLKDWETEYWLKTLTELFPEVFPDSASREL